MMDSDYRSTAKALALPVSPVTSPSPERQPMRPLRPRPNSRPVGRDRSSPLYSPRQPQTYQVQALKYVRRIVGKFMALPVYQRILAVLALVITNVIMILLFIYNEQIFGFLTPYAAKWRDMPGGYLILWALTFICAFPPIFGYSTTITVAGFVYGFPNGWFIISTATVCGSLVSFIASRTVFSSYVHRLVGQDSRFEALALTLKHDGLKVLCMIRFCPLPYSISNAAISTFPTVHPLSFALATAISSPKLLVHVFIGSRMAAIAEIGQDHHFDARTKVINYISIAFGLVLGATVGCIIFRRTMARAHELEITELQSREFDPVSSSALDIDRDAAALIDNESCAWHVGTEHQQTNGGYRDHDASDDCLDHYVDGDISEETTSPIARQF